MQKLDGSDLYVKFFPPFYSKILIAGIIVAFISLFLPILWIISIPLILFPIYGPYVTNKFYMTPIDDKPNYKIVSREEYKKYKENHNLQKNKSDQTKYNNYLIQESDQGKVYMVSPSNNSFDKWGFNKSQNPNLGFEIVIRNNNRILTFPQSNSKQSFYLLSIDFTADIKTDMKIKGKTGSSLIGGALFGGVGAVVGSSGGRKVETKTTEKDSIAYMHLISTDFKEESNFEIYAKQEFVNRLQGSLAASQMFLQQKYDELNKSEKEEVKEKVIDTGVNSENTDNVDKIKKYKSLLDQGIITEEEFEAKKKQLLNL